jgi:hypothetical protein
MSSVFKLIGDIARIVAKVIPVVVGALQGLRGLVPEIEEGFIVVEQAINKGEKEADSFVDRNRPAFEKTVEIGREIRDLGNSVAELSSFCLLAAEDDSFTLAESKVALRRLNEVRICIQALADIEIPDFK